MNKFLYTLIIDKNIRENVEVRSEQEKIIIFLFTYFITVVIRGLIIAYTELYFLNILYNKFTKK